MAFQSLQSAENDERREGTALEYLESVLPPAIRARLWPFIERRPAARSAEPARPREKVIADLLALEPFHRAEPRGTRGRLADDRHRRPMTMAKPQLLQPRLDTLAPDTSDRTSQRLPDALLSDQIRRLAISAAVGAGLWTYGLAMDTLVRPLTIGVPLDVLQRRGRNRGNCHVAADVRVCPVRPGRARPQVECRPRVLRPECGRRVGHRHPDGAGTRWPAAAGCPGTPSSFSSRR